MGVGPHGSEKRRNRSSWKLEAECTSSTSPRICRRTRRQTRCCPWQLGTWAPRGGRHRRVRRAPAARPGHADLAGPVTWVPRRAAGSVAARLRADLPGRALRIRRALIPAFARADVVHVHSNGLLAELAVLLARRRRRPVVLTLYGTEIWHYRPKRVGPDLFTRAYRRGVDRDVLQRAPARACPRARADATADGNRLPRGGPALRVARREGPSGGARAARHPEPSSAPERQAAASAGRASGISSRR